MIFRRKVRAMTTPESNAAPVNPNSVVTLAVDTPQDTLDQLNALGDGKVYVRTGEDPNAVKASAAPVTEAPATSSVTPPIVAPDPTAPATTASAPADATSALVTISAAGDLPDPAKIEAAAINVVKDAASTVSADVPALASVAGKSSDELIKEIHGLVSDTQAKFEQLTKFVEEVGSKLADHPILGKLFSF